MFHVAFIEQDDFEDLKDLKAFHGCWHGKNSF